MNICVSIIDHNISQWVDRVINCFQSNSSTRLLENNYGQCFEPINVKFIPKLLKLLTFS